ncbi:MAG: hypothetical protein Kow00124_12260 [Anaerolineae bacterium]
MMPELGRIGPFVIRSYTLLLDLAILTSLGLLAWQGWRRGKRPVDWLDAGLAALVGGLLLGRAVHVAVHWAYFEGHLGEAAQLWRGGIDWHGALAGGLAGVVVYCRALPLSFRQVSDTLALLLPIGALLAFGGCLLSSCSYGREVMTLADYPPPLALELPDVYGVVSPRLASQVYGLVLSTVVLIAALVLTRLVRREGVRFWIVLALLGGGVFAIGFTRGDPIPMLGSLRLDQMLDLLIAGAGIMGAVIASLPSPPGLPTAPPAG